MKTKRLFPSGKGNVSYMQKFQEAADNPQHPPYIFPSSGHSATQSMVKEIYIPS